MKERTKNYLVTGGSGFIGSHLIDRLLKEEDSKITIVDNFREGRYLPFATNVEIVNMSILGDLSELMRRQDVVFHFAAVPRVQTSIQEPKRTHEVNVDGTLNLLLAARDNGVKRFVFSSSSSIYGDQDKTPFTEDMIPNPLSPYALHKLIGEGYCQLFTKIYGLQTICLRYFNVYGPRMNSLFNPQLIPNVIKHIKEDRQPPIAGDGSVTRDYVFVTDVAEANYLASKSDLTGIFNIGTGVSCSVNEIIDLINKKLGKDIKGNYGPPVIEPSRTIADITKAKYLLGWEPKVSLDEGIERAINGI